MTVPIFNKLLKKVGPFLTRKKHHRILVPEVKITLKYKFF